MGNFNFSPGIIAMGVGLGALMLLLGRSGGNSSSNTLAATLQSMNIAAQQQVALAQIGAGRDVSMDEHATAVKLALVQERVVDNLAARQTLVNMAQIGAWRQVALASLN